MDQSTVESQDIDAPLTDAAAMLVLTINSGDEAAAKVRSVLASTDDLIKDVRIRTRTDEPFNCNVAIGSDAWERLTDRAKPAELAPFKQVKGDKHTAVSTPGDLLYHVRAARFDVIVEFEKILLEAFGDSVVGVDDVAGFRYFDARDLLEFVDGTANPDGAAMSAATIVGDEDAEHAGGSYVVVQKYLHDLGAWKKQATATQEEIIGRTKFDNVELPDATEGQKSHKTLCTITDEAGEHDIVRDNMPFATPGKGEYGTYFIGYSRHQWVIDKMLERMFIGDPAPLHDRILDFSTAVTGVAFFAPSRQFLAGLDG